MDLELDHENVFKELQKMPEFDSKAFQQLTEDTDQQVALKILARFSVTLLECLQQIEVGLQQDDGDSIWKACHKMAGSGELVGFKQFGSEARSLIANLKALNDTQSHLAEIQYFLTNGFSLKQKIESSFTNIKSYL